MKNPIPRFLATSALLFSLGGAHAAGAAPDALVRVTVDEVLSVIKDNNDRRTLNELAEKKILPNFDFREMTQLAVGKAWRGASPAQQLALESGFRTLLVNTYVTALRQQGGAQDRSVQVAPLQAKADADDVTVKTLVREPGRQPVSINYRMASKPEGWKVYDVLVENVSLVSTYRGSFAEEIARSGLDGLIRALDNKNRSNVRS